MTNEAIIKLKFLFKEEAAIVDLQVLGIIGMMLSGSWMSKFYTDLKTEKDPVNTIQIVKGVISNLKIFQYPMHILLAKKRLI